MTEAMIAERSLRADAQRNLESILEAAAAAFAEGGLDVGVADIAKRAGVGQATIFRRFETKDDLIAAVVHRKLDFLMEVAEQAAGRKSAWDGLREFMTKATELNMRDKGLFEAVGERLMSDPHFLAVHERLLAHVGDIVERAKAEGDLRRDLHAQDIPVLTCSAAQAGSMTRGADPELWRRYLQIVFDGMRADGCQSRLKPGSPSMEKLRESMREVAQAS